MNHDQTVRFRQMGDAGDEAPEAIQPLSDGEILDAAALMRATHHLRRRTSLLGKEVSDLKYLADYDRSLLFRSDHRFILTDENLPTGGMYRLRMSGGELAIHPALTPGTHSGGRYKGGRVFVNDLPYAGVLGLDDLTLTTHSDYTGQRAYADGASLAEATTLSLGANEIEISLVADSSRVGGAATISAAVQGTPARRFTVTYGTLTTPTTLAEIISFINGDTNSQGTYGLSHVFRASTTSSGTSVPPALTLGRVQGQYDAEAHRISAAFFDAFFSDAENLLLEGEGLAIAYPKGLVETGAAPLKAGRRQSLLDWPTNRVGSNVDNTEALIGNLLFNTGREPEKIPGAIPIGKIINGEFVFCDGVTRVPAGPPSTDPDSGVLLGISYGLIQALSNEIDTPSGFPPTGASVVGYGGSPNWHADQTALGDQTLLAGNLETTLDSVVTQLAAGTTNNSGARKIGAEAVAAIVSPTNLPLALPSSSIQAAIAALLNTPATSAVGGGVNCRVSERGHRLVGSEPLEKRFNEGATTPAGTAFLRAVCATAGDLAGRADLSTAEILQPATVTLVPFSIDNGSVLFERAMAIQAGTTTDAVRCLLSVAQVRELFRSVPLITDQSAVYGGANTQAMPSLIARIENLNGGVNGNGFYWVKAIDDSTADFQLLTLDSGTPDFTGATFPGTPAATITLYYAVMTGTGRGTELQTIVAPPTPYGAVCVHAVYGVTTGPTYTEYPWLCVYRPDHAVAALGTPPVIACQMYPTKALWNETPTVVRHTQNILVTGDKSLLDGVETSSIVDATASHHHGTQLSRTVQYTSGQVLIAGGNLLTYISFVTAVPTPYAPNTVNTYLHATDAVLAGIVASTRRVMSLVRGAVSFKTKSTVVAGDRILFALAFDADSATLHREFFDFRAAGPNLVHTFAFQAWLPLNKDNASTGALGGFALWAVFPDVDPGFFTGENIVITNPVPLTRANAYDSGVTPADVTVRLVEQGAVIDF